MITKFQRNLDHSKAAYTFAINSLNSIDPPPSSRHQFFFEKESQIESMMIEFGWAFFVRYEACLEAYIKERKVVLSKSMNLLQWLEEKKVDIPQQYIEPLKEYRKIRNILHHDDGKTGIYSEIHLLPNHMESFYEFFVWCANQVDSLSRPD